MDVSSNTVLITGGASGIGLALAERFLHAGSQVIICGRREDKLKEATFQRQQYQKKMLFLEELNRDLQEATEQHKKMESQLRRIKEMESILSRSFPKEPPPPPAGTPII